MRSPAHGLCEVGQAISASHLPEPSANREVIILLPGWRLPYAVSVAGSDERNDKHHREEPPMIKLVARYTRYVLSSLATVAFASIN